MSSNKDDENNEAGTSITAIPAQYLQNASVQEYLQKMQQHSTLPLSLQQFLKFNNPEIKREQITEEGVIETINITQEDQEQLILNEVEGEMETEENVDDPDKGKKKRSTKRNRQTEETEAGTGPHRNRAGRDDAVLLSRMSHGLPGKGIVRTTSNRTQDRKAVYLRYMRGGFEAKRTSRKTQTRSQSGEAFRVFRLYERVQT
jgi:hypothetical protein